MTDDYDDDYLSDDEIDEIMADVDDDDDVDDDVRIVRPGGRVTVPLLHMDHAAPASSSPPMQLHDASMGGNLCGHRPGFYSTAATPMQDSDVLEAARLRYANRLASAWKNPGPQDGPSPPRAAAPSFSGLSGDALYESRKRALNSAWSAGKLHHDSGGRRISDVRFNDLTISSDPAETRRRAESLLLLSSDQQFELRKARLADAWKQP